MDELIVVSRSPGPRENLTLIRRLRRFAPDAAIDFFCNPRTALWTFLSGARARVGYPRKGWRSALYTHHARPRTLSAIGFHLASLASLGWPAAGGTPRLHVGAPARAGAARELESLGVPAGARCVGFHPGARWMTRRWDAANFVALAARFLEHDREGVALVTGGPGDDALVASVIQGLDRARAHAVVG